MALGVLRLILEPLRLARDSEVGEQYGMNNDFAVCRTGELIDNQADALPKRLNRRAPLHGRAGSARFACCRKLPEHEPKPSSPPLFSCRRSTPDSSELFPLYVQDAWVKVPCPYDHPNVARGASVPTINAAIEQAAQGTARNVVVAETLLLGRFVPVNRPSATLDGLLVQASLADRRSRPVGAQHQGQRSGPRRFACS